MNKKILGFVFIFFIILASYQCARRGNPTGGPKDLTGPVLIKAEPPNLSVNFKSEKIRLYFDELVKLKDVQEQLIISPPLKYPPVLSPMGNAQKYVEINIKDTLQENTTYTFNFGQSIVDNNEENPAPFFTYVFSTGSYLDSLEVSGVITDAFNKDADTFVSVMLYKIDSTYNDSTVYNRPPNYITNTLDSTFIFRLKNLKEGQYALLGLKDESKNNLFDQKTDKIGFIKDTITLPTDSIYLLNLFKEIPDYSAAVPSMEAKNRINFGFYGDGSQIEITPLTTLPDTVKTIVTKVREKDSLNFWFTPYDMDSIVFSVTNERLKVSDTFTIKKRKLGLDTLLLTTDQKGSLDFGKPFNILVNTPIVGFDTTKIKLMDKDSISVKNLILFDTLENKLKVDFEYQAEQNYRLELLPGAITDFFTETNDSISLNLRTKSLAEYGNLTLDLNGGNINYPILVQLTTEKGILAREIYAFEPQSFVFNNLDPGNYMARVIFDENQNGKWDTGNYLKKIQPEKITYYPTLIEMRANWEKIETFNLTN